jgi:hypothetical protein
MQKRGRAAHMAPCLDTHHSYFPSGKPPPVSYPYRENPNRTRSVLDTPLHRMRRCTRRCWKRAPCNKQYVMEDQQSTDQDGRSATSRPRWKISNQQTKAPMCSSSRCVDMPHRANGAGRPYFLYDTNAFSSWSSFSSARP